MNINPATYLRNLGNSWLEYCKNLLERIASGRGASIRVALASWALSTFLASPPLFAWRWDFLTGRGRSADYLRLCADPFARNLIEPLLAYRLTTPVLAWLLNLPPVGALALPYLINVAFLAVMFIALRKRLKALPAFLTVIIVALSFPLFWSNWNTGLPDSTTHLFTVIMMINPGVFVTLVASLLGFLNDERMILALPFVLLWHYGSPEFHRAWWYRAIRWICAVLVGTGAYLVIRHALTVGWIGPGIVRPQVYGEMAVDVSNFRPWLRSWPVAILNIFLGFRWAWLLMASFSMTLIREKHYGFATYYLCALALGALASVLVADVSKSIGYAFPALLLAAAELNRRNAIQSCNRLFWIIAALVVTPAFYTIENFVIQWYRPLPLVIFRILTGWDLGHYIIR
jgi:hypothetical protein